MADTSLSLEEIIKNKQQTFKKRNINTVKRFGKKITQTSFATKNKDITDVRNKIIQKKRLKIGDAREKLGQIAIQGDARERLNNLKRAKLKVSNSRVSENIGATNPRIQGRNRTRIVPKVGSRATRIPNGAPGHNRNRTRTTTTNGGRAPRNPTGATQRNMPRDNFNQRNMQEINHNVRIQQRGTLQTQRMRPTIVRESRYPKEPVYRQTRPVVVRETRPVVMRETRPVVVRETRPVLVREAYVSEYDDPISYGNSAYMDDYEEPKIYRERLHVDEYEEPIRKRGREYVDEYVLPNHHRDRVYVDERDAPIRNRDRVYDDERDAPIRNRNRVYDDERDAPIRNTNRVYDDERDAPIRNRNNVYADDSDYDDEIDAPRRTKPVYSKFPSSRKRVYADDSDYDDEIDAPRRTNPIYSKFPSTRPEPTRVKRPTPMSSALASRLDQENPRPQQGQKIVVANLHPCVCADDIEELFSTIGTIIKSRMIKESVAEVVFLKREDALKAIEVFHNRQLDGLPMQVNLVRRK